MKAATDAKTAAMRRRLRRRSRWQLRSLATSQELQRLSKPAVQSAAPIANDDAVKERILALAVDKTGYPADMLDLDWIWKPTSESTR